MTVDTDKRYLPHTKYGDPNKTYSYDFVNTGGTARKVNLPSSNWYIDGTAVTGTAAQLNAATGGTGISTPTQAVIAGAGTDQTNGTAITKTNNLVTGADGTVGVVLPTPVAGYVVRVVNTVTTTGNVLKVYPGGASVQINALTASTGAFSVGPGREAIFVATSATQWYTAGHNADTSTTTEANLLTGLTSSTAEINRNNTASTRIVAGGSSLAATLLLHDGKTVKLDTAGGTTVTLPAASGSGARFRFVVSVRPSGGSHIIKVANASDSMGGTVTTLDLDAAALTAYDGATGTSDTITINNTTTGGAIGDWIECEDVLTNIWAVRGMLNIPTGSNPVSPFSNTV